MSKFKHPKVWPRCQKTFLIWTFNEKNPIFNNSLPLVCFLHRFVFPQSFSMMFCLPLPSFYCSKSPLRPLLPKSLRYPFEIPRNLHSLITDLILYHIDRRLVVHSGGNKCYFRLSVVSNSSPNHYRSFISQIMKVITATVWSNFNLCEALVSFSFFFSYFIVPESLITRRIVCVHATICRALRENFDGSRKWQAYFSQLNHAIYLKPPFTVVPLCCSSQHSWVSYFSIIMWGKLIGFYWVAE